MSILITDHMLAQANVQESKFRMELAVFLFEKGILSLGKAAEVAQIHRFELQLELANREIPIHYGLEEYEADLKTIEKMDADT